jgi:hypothetical protein
MLRQYVRVGKMDFWDKGLSVQKPQMPDWL